MTNETKREREEHFISLLYFITAVMEQWVPSDGFRYEWLIADDDNSFVSFRLGAVQ